MSLTKQLVPVQMGNGINTKVDPLQLQAGQLLTLANAQFSKTGQLNKRYGSTILNNIIEGGGSIQSAVELTTYGNELILFDGNNLYTYLKSSGLWSNRGTAISVTTQDKDIIRLSAAQQLNPDMGYLNGVEVYAWEDSRGGVRYSVIDTATGANAAYDQPLNSQGVKPKVIVFQNQVFIFYAVGVELFYQTVNPYNPTVISAPVTTVADGYSVLGFPYDAAVIGNQLFVAYLSDSTSTGAIQAYYINSGFTKSTTTVVNNTPGVAINTGYNGAVNVVGDSNQNAWISWANGVDVRVSCYPYNLGVVLVNSVLVMTGDVVVLTGIESPTALTLLLNCEKYNSTSYNESLQNFTISPAGSVTMQQTILSVGLATKAFKYNGNIYVNVAYQSTLQSTDFTFLLAQGNTILTKPVIVAKETPSVGGGLQTNGMCPEIPALSAGTFKFANLIAGKIISEANTLFSLLGVNSTELIFTPSDNFANTTQSKTLLIVGGILQGYDGNAATEVGFHLYPENITASPTTGGSLSTGTYEYQVEFEWTDNNGNIYRSAPSVPISLQVSAGQAVSLAGPMLRLTAKTTAISIVIYRTNANGSTFNRVTSTLLPLLNSTTSNTWTYTDTLADVDATSNELIYTTGGILANIAPPANAVICTYGDRVFLTGMSDPLLMWYSQTVVDNSNSNTIPTQFCQELTMTTDPRGGSITGLGLNNQILIIFKYSNIFALQGNGPDATGNNNDYGDATLVTSDVGCINDQSIVIVPQGLMFQSSKGIYLLDQSLNLTYIGAPVEAFTSASSVSGGVVFNKSAGQSTPFTITGAVLNNTANQVIFTTSGGTSLVYDYYMQQWSTWTNQYAVSCTMYNDVFCYVNAAGTVYMQNTEEFTDNGTPILMSFTLPNLSFAGIQGYQRVFRMLILGTYKGPHTLNVSVAYDDNPSYTQFATITPSTNISYWGSDANWGNSQYWGGGFNLYEFRIDFAIQKCTSIRIFVTDNQSSNYNEGYAISSIVFEVGVMPGANRLPTTVNTTSTS